MNANHDVFGSAGMDYMLSPSKKKRITVWTDVAETDYIPLHYLFRAYGDMPSIEQKALSLWRGKILDVGACMGVHSLYLQECGADVTAFELSPLACEVMQKRGVRQIINSNFMRCEPQAKYDTIMLLMNGAGIAGTIAGLPDFFAQVKKHLATGGQILLDSTDIRYLFEDEDGSMRINLNGKYYGELTYRLSYRNCKSELFPWFFIDYNLLAIHAQQYGFSAEKIMDGLHYDYLAKLTMI
ncbi:MAG: class I SAM-dependent methyltransferase [Cytophagaceae bacterium]|jgi:hypothetical protein|nr:class I SAM-dependent methyltransferase [Cytophagaceae bacterium]